MSVDFRAQVDLLVLVEQVRLVNQHKVNSKTGFSLYWQLFQSLATLSRVHLFAGRR